MNEQQNIALVKQAYAAFGRGDMVALLATMDENIDWRPVVGAGPDVPHSARCRGKKNVQGFFESLAKTTAFSAFEPREFVAQGDRVVVFGHYASKILTTGRLFESDWVMAFTIKNGKVTTFVEFSDSAGLDRAFAVKK